MSMKLKPNQIVNIFGKKKYLKICGKHRMAPECFNGHVYMDISNLIKNDRNKNASCRLL